MAHSGGPKRPKVRGNQPKAHFGAGLAEIVSETVRIWRKHHLGYDQTKYVVEQARRGLKLQPVHNRRENSEPSRQIGSGAADPQHVPVAQQVRTDDQDSFPERCAGG